MHICILIMTSNTIQKYSSLEQNLKHKKVSVIVKPTNRCNLACKYCYAESGEGEMMSYETLENMISKLQRTYDGIEYIWHGGEPLLMGIDFYEKVIEIEKREKSSNQWIINTVQTNGTLMNQEWIDFFKKNDFTIGLSLDGPEEVNNLTRIYPDGSGTFRCIMNSIELMKKNDMRFGAICILTGKNIDSIEEIYSFFKQENIGVKFNPVYLDGRANKHKDLELSPKKYGLELIKLFNRWFLEDEFVSVSQFEDFVSMILSNSPVGCSFHDTCQDTFVSVDDKGDVYPCGRFAGNKEFKYGNINVDSLENLMEHNPKRNSFIDRNVYECKDCEFFDKCHSGCPHNAYSTYGDINKKDQFCHAYKMLLKHIDNVITEELDKAYMKKSQRG